MSPTTLRPDRTETARHRGAGSPTGAPRALARALPLLAVAPLLGGCDFVVLRPMGYVAEQQRNLVLAATGLMLLIIVPVIVCTLLFAWRYRATNEEAVYDPDWHHSTQLEVLIWTAPLMIIIALGALTWIGTHTLDPFRPLTRLDTQRPVPAGTEPLEVEAVALDWKWLFFYPQYGVATVNELAAPVDRPITFKITASDVMNTFYVPTLAGMVYAMPGMETKLHAVINKAGTYEGRSAHYSGTGFSGMSFAFQGLDGAAFDQWIAKVKDKGGDLSQEAYIDLEKPSEAEPARYYKSYAEGLYGRIMNMCAAPGKMCMSEMMRLDAAGGVKGPEGEANFERLQYDNRRTARGEEPPGATAPASGTRAHGQTQPQGMQPRPGTGNPESRGEGSPQPHDHPGGHDIAPKQLNN